MFDSKPTEDKCDKCKDRRKEGYVYCLCGNRLMETKNVFVQFKGTGWGCKN